jgi:hypothetical protein
MIARTALGSSPISVVARVLPVTALGLFLTVMAVAPLSANNPLPQPSGRVLLTITGNIDRTNADGRAEFDRQMLEELGVTGFATSTSWTDGAPRFEGVLARDVLKAVGASGDTVTATALNDYSIEIPVADFESYPVLFAMRMDGTELTRRDKGPIWIVYPRDGHRELQNQKVDARWIWQLVKLQVR